MKILNTLWFTQLGGPLIGVVDVDFEDGEGVQSYIGTGNGWDEQADAKHIALCGARFTLPTGTSCHAVKELIDRIMIG